MKINVSHLVEFFFKNRLMTYLKWALRDKVSSKIIGDSKLLKHRATLAIKRLTGMDMKLIDTF